MDKTAEIKMVFLNKNYSVMFGFDGYELFMDDKRFYNFVDLGNCHMKPILLDNKPCLEIKTIGKTKNGEANNTDDYFNVAYYAKKKGKRTFMKLISFEANFVGSSIVAKPTKKEIKKFNKIEKKRLCFINKKGE